LLNSYIIKQYEAKREFDAIITVNNLVKLVKQNALIDILFNMKTSIYNKKTLQYSGGLTTNVSMVGNVGELRTEHLSYGKLLLKY
jgi:hypothetical protein